MTVRVLYATDGSPGAEAARELLAGSFRPAEVTVDVVHVIVAPIGLVPGTWSAESVTLDIAREDADAAVGAAAAALREAGFSVSGEVVMGHPAAEIVRLAEERHPDLVLVGTRGLTGIRRALVGSVAGSVATHAPTAVLMAHGPSSIGHVLVGVDGSANAEAALRFLERLPFTVPPRVTVATAYEVPVPFRSGVVPTLQVETSAAYVEDLEAVARHAAATAQRAAASLTGTWAGIETRTVGGAPRHALGVLTQDIGADLVVVGCRGQSAVSRFLLGSTSSGLVAHPPASVLVVHAPHAADAAHAAHPES